MSEWIEGLEENAKKILSTRWHFKDGYLLDDRGNIENSYPNVEYDTNLSDEIELHGEFSLQQLQDLVVHMKKYGGQ